MHKLNILINFHALSKSPREVEGLSKVLDCNPSMNFFLDSGAFPAWNSGRKIVLENYIQFLKDPPLRIDRYFTLDVIGDTKATKVNYLKMLEAGLNPIPVFTRGASFDDIDFYYQTSDLISLGGLVGLRKVHNYVKKCMRFIGDRKVHW